MIGIAEEQVLYFRAQRGHLAGPGAADLGQAARSILGGQSQQLGPAALALSMRTESRPTAQEVRGALLEEPRRLVRTWGQRDTLHLYDLEDWSLIVAADEEWVTSGRRGGMPPAEAVDAAGALLAERGVLTRSDVFPLLSSEYLRSVKNKVGAGDPARRFCAGRLLWKLAHRGDACSGGKVGAEQSYAARTAWFPDLAWPRTAMPAQEAATELTRRYLAVYGPATPADVAHFFGARVSNARAWIECLGEAGDIVDVDCGGRKGLVTLGEDVRLMRAKPPSAISKWPVRLLPMWESMMMGHADKSWTVPDEDERKLVWKKSAVVAAVVLDRGRVVATWAHEERAPRLEVTVTPLSLWTDDHLAGVRDQAQTIAAHLELEDVDVAVE